MTTAQVVEDIVIVGAGIAGLTTSLGLHRLGIPSLVLKYSDKLRVTGFALSTWQNAWKALDAVGVGSILRPRHLQLNGLGIPSLVLESSDTLRVTGFALSTWQNAWKALDAVGVGSILRPRHLQLNGFTTTSLVTGQQTSTISFDRNGKHGSCEIRCVRRKLMLEALANELPRGTIRYMSKVVAIEESGFYKILHLANGSTLKTKVLIGCDGVNSMVAKWLGFKEAAFTGRQAVRGWAESESNHGFEHKFMQFFGKGFRAGVIPLDQKTAYWFFTWTPTAQEKELEENPTKLKQFVLNKLEKMPTDFRCFIEKTELDCFHLGPLRYRQPWELMLGNISKGNVCVAGDALHPMTPDLGQGGCSALEDGVILARCLAEALSEKLKVKKGKEEDEYKRIEESLKRYADERRWRSIDLIISSYMVGFVQQANSKWATFFRDKILALFLTDLLLKKTNFDCGRLNSSYDEFGCKSENEGKGKDE